MPSCTVGGGAADGQAGRRCRKPLSRSMISYLRVSFTQLRLFHRYARVVEDSWYDRLEQQWSEANPELELRSSTTAGRLGRLALLLARRQDRLFGRFGLSRGEVGLLGALSAAGPDSLLTPTILMRRLLLSSAGVTSRLDRMERAGLVRRLPDPSDRRGVLIELTPEGKRVMQEAVEANARDSQQFLSPLTEPERSMLDRTLRKLLQVAEPMGD